MRVKVLLTALLVALFAVSAVHAQGMGPGWRGHAPQRQAIPDPAAVIRQGLKELQAFMGQSPRPSEMRLAAYLEEQVAPNFDFQLMARSVAGPAYRRMGEERRVDLEQHIAQDFLKVLTTGLARFDGQNVRFMPTRQGRGQRASVSVAIANPGTYPSRLEFRLYFGREGWKVYDVIANSNSAVSYYRQKFAAKLRRVAYVPRMPMARPANR